MNEARSRCFLVYALAPEGLSAREANELLNAYIGETGRGLIVSHDHFTGRPHGGFAVFEVQTEEEEAKLGDPGPLAGWQISSHALTFSLTAVGFVAQADFTLRNYGGTSLADLERAESPEQRFWWQRHRSD
ncbi:MAG TPA: hypothetical protein VF877_05660 [Gaiellaceae bacterium]